MQRRTAQDHLLPWVKPFMPTDRSWKVLEVGCAEAGVLKAFLQHGHSAMGIELDEHRAGLAKQFLAEEIAEGRASIRRDNIYDVEAEDLLEGGFDLVILKDVIEHIEHQELMVPRLAEFLAPGGRIVFAFPPWLMPFGGHQQLGFTPWVSRIPWLHVLPKGLYARYLKMVGEPEHIQKELISIYNTGISIERFEGIVRQSGLHQDARILWLFNPIYAFKFGIKAQALPSVFAALPYIRNTYCTAAYYLVSRQDEQRQQANRLPKQLEDHAPAS